nr:transposase [Nonomuraea lactucae]
MAVDPHNTSRTCARCGHCAKENRVTQAEFACQACGHTAHADTNAATNILRAGLALRRAAEAA